MTTARSVPVLGDEAVASHLDLEAAVDAVAAAFQAAHDGTIQAPPRMSMGPAPGTAVMLAHDGRWSIVKSFVPGSEDPPFITVYDVERRRLLAHLASATLSRVRTGVVSALATMRLAKPGSTRLALIGAGRQARGHVDVLIPTLGLGEVRIYSRTANRAAALAEHVRATHGIDAAIADDVAAALDGSDIACTATTSRDPVVDARHLHPGLHILLVGANRRGRREISVEAVAECKSYVDDLAAAREESEELRSAVGAGLLTWDRVTPLSSLLAGSDPGRTSEHDITLFKNLGSGIADVALARLVVEEAGIA